MELSGKRSSKWFGKLLFIDLPITTKKCIDNKVTERKTRIFFGSKNPHKLKLFPTYSTLL